MKKLPKLQVIDNDARKLSVEEKKHILGGFADAADGYTYCGESCAEGCKESCKSRKYF